MEKKGRSETLMSVLGKLLMQADLTANGLATILSVPTPTVHRLATGDVQDPRLSTMLLLADHFGITLEQLIGRAKLDPHYYADRFNNVRRPDVSIPFLNLEDTFTLDRSIKRCSRWFRWQSQDGVENDKAFAIQIKGDLYQSVFPANSVVVIDSKGKPEQGDYVLVHYRGETMPVFKRYFSEGKNKYLCMIQGDVKTEKYDADTMKIIGVVLETVRHLKN